MLIELKQKSEEVVSAIWVKQNNLLDGQQLEQVDEYIYLGGMEGLRKIYLCTQK